MTGKYRLNEILDAYRKAWEMQRARKEYYHPPEYKCAQCKDMGFINIYPPGNKEPHGGPVMYCPHCRADMLRDISGIVAEYKNLDIAKFPWDTYRSDTTKLRRTLESFVYDFQKWRDEGVGLYIYSEARGSGKTMAASAICGSICAKYNIASRFSKAEDFIAEVKKTFDNKKSYGSRDNDTLSVDRIRKYYDTELLVLDDLGVTKITEWGQGVLHDLINERYKLNRLCVITSNFRPKDLPVHAATIDRINDMCLQVNFPEEPVRARQATARKNRLVEHMESYDKFTAVSGDTPFGKVDGGNETR